MQHVAYDVVKHAFMPAPVNPAPTPSSSGRGSNSPFESLLDDSTQAANDPPAPSPSASNDKTAAAAKSPAAQAPARPADGKAANPNDHANAADAGPAPTPDAAAKDCKASSNGKATTDAKTFVQAAAGDDTKPAGDGTQANSPTPTSLAVDPASNPILTVTPTVGIATAPGTGTNSPVSTLNSLPAGGIGQAAPAAIPEAMPAPVSMAVPLADEPPATGTDAQMAPVGATPDQTEIFVADASKGQVIYPAVPQVGVPKAKTADVSTSNATAGKLADNSNAPAKASFALPGEGKPQPATGDTSKPDPAHPNDEVATNTHHAGADAQPSIATDVQGNAAKITGDTAQPASLSPQLHDVSPAPINPAAPAPTAPTQAVAVPLAGVAFEIAGKALAGNSHFEIRLDPPELGRIEVRLNVDRDGHITSHLIADRSDTLNLLRRDASGLERALQDAGLKTADNGLQFSLRDQSMGRDQSNTPTPGAAQIVVHDDALPAIETTQRNYSRLAGLRGGIDIRV